MLHVVQVELMDPGEAEVRDWRTSPYITTIVRSRASRFHQSLE